MPLPHTGRALHPPNLGCHSGSICAPLQGFEEWNQSGPQELQFVCYELRSACHDSRISHHQSRFFPQHAKSACHPVPAECQALLGETLRQLFAFACPSYPCSGFPEPTGALTTHRPLGSRNSSPMTYPSGCGRQYATRARARKPPGNDSMFSVSLGRQRRTLGTRAPRELTSSVNVVSTWEADWCPEIWTATVIGILFSRRSIANVCAIISLSKPAGAK